MRAAARGDDADTEFARHIHGRGHGLGGDHEAKAVLSIERANHRGDPLDHQFRLGIDQSAPHPIEIMRQKLQSMGIDAAQVGAHQATGDDGRVLLRQAVRDQQAAAESLRRLHRGVERTFRRRRLAPCHSRLSCQLPFKPYASGKNKSFQEAGFFLSRPTLYMKSTNFITLTGVVV